MEIVLTKDFKYDKFLAHEKGGILHIERRVRRDYSELF
jgi:hypothetical protein